MKKGRLNPFWVFMLALAMLLDLCACGGKKKNDAGYYILSSIKGGGMTVDGAMMKELYGTAYLVLNEGGTGYMVFDDEAADLTWESGKITMDGETTSYTLKDDVLTISEEGIEMSFTRSDETPPAKPKKAEETEETEEPEETEETEEPEETRESTETEKSTNANSEISPEPVSGTLGDFEVTIVAAEEFTDSDDKPAIRFYYDFTNNSEDLESAVANLNPVAFQEGYELKGTYYVEDVVPEADNRYLDIIPGMTIRCIGEYAFKPDGGTLEFKLEDFWSDATVSMTFDPKNLPGRPEELEMQVISEPTWTKDMPSEGDLQEMYHLRFDRAEIAETYDGTALRVYFEFTNNSDETTSPYYATSFIALQDGVSLDSGYPIEYVPEDDALSEEIAPGETSMAAVCFAIRSDSPIEVIAEDIWSGTDLAAVFPAE